MKRIWVLALLIAGCSDQGNRVTIDVTPLITRGAQSGLPVTKLTLTVTGPGIETAIITELDLDNPVFDIAVPAGPNRLFVVDARGEEDVPIFWGEQLADVLARTDNELVIPAFPAGQLNISIVWVGLEPPDFPVPFELRAIEPREDQRARIAIDGSQATVQQPLPTGRYRFETDLQVGDRDIVAIPSQTPIEIVQGESVSVTLSFAVPGECNPELGLTPDLDRDGLSCEVDCDDRNPNCGVTCTDDDGDGFCVDQDCDDTPDEGSGCQTQCATFYEDSDDDGFGDDETAVTQCVSPIGFVTQGGDCDDALPFCSETCLDEDQDTYCGVNDCNDQSVAVNIDAEEFPGDAIDSNCDGLELCYVDQDRDGDGTRELPTVTSSSITCDATGVSRTGIDCNDQDSNLSFIDQDGDGVISCVEINGLDCDETNPLVNSNKPERCNDSIDNDCDGLVDFFDPDCVAFVDVDGDGYNESPLAPGVIDCMGLSIVDADNDGFSECAGDCDDSNALIFPGAPLRCQLGVTDSNCNSVADVEECIGCVDDDNDGYCDGEDCNDDDELLNLDDLDRDGLTTCSDAPFTDCDDTWFLAPIPGLGLIEFCFDGRDNDCDGAIEGADPDCACPDNDGDGFACSDCDDDPITGVDCFIPDECRELGIDRDGDFYVDPAAGTRSTCENTLRLGDDCNDDDPTINPGALEICGNDINENCSELGAMDDFDRDQDGDGFFDPSCGGTDCNDLDASAKPVDLDEDGVDACTDPNDFSASVGPGFEDVCDGIDNDGDGFIDNFLTNDSDSDQDNDGVADCLDNCPEIANGGAMASSPPPQRVRIEWLRDFSGSIRSTEFPHRSSP
ncbi:MAG: MopE-related protein, partial [Myxococcota bacterium]